MGYPTSVFSPAVRSNGQTIDASHTNDLQTEMTAVQTALLGTITHSVNISGASTLATLQAAASTFTVRPVTPPPHAARVYLDSTVTLGSSANSTIAWTAQDVLTNSSAHSTGTNPSRLTPQSTGLYQFAVQVGYTANSTGTRGIYLRDSSGGDLGRVEVPASSVAQSQYVQAVGLKRFDALGGYVVVLAITSGNSTLSISAGIEASWFSMVKL